MAAVTANGITIEYEERGRKSDPALVLIMGLGNQLTAWPEEFCAGLAKRGFRVILFDNRDVGLSTKFSGKRSPHLVPLVALSRIGIRLRVPYTLEDMVADTVGLLDALQIETAHLCGISMGGMIAQILAARHKERVRTLTCMITSSGNPRLPGPRKKVLKKLLRRPQGMDKETWINFYEEIFTLIGSPAADRAELRRRIEVNVERSLYPAGTTRQFAAIIHGGSRVKLLREIAAPTLVISGAADPLVPYQGGQDIAANVKGARFELIEGMGHDLPPHLLPRLIDLITGHAADADANCKGGWS